VLVADAKYGHRLAVDLGEHDRSVRVVRTSRPPRRAFPDAAGGTTILSRVE
jgi:hypothetical protein